MSEKLSFMSELSEGISISEQEAFASSTRLIISVPVFKEHANGNIYRLLDSFASQSADSSAFGVQILVNNTTESANASDEGFRDNQQTLYLGTLLNSTDSIPAEIQGYRRDVIEKVRKKSLQVTMLDYSTSGVERNIGLIRDIGVDAASEFFNQQGMGERGVIAQMDADTVVNRHYVRDILQTFANGTVDSAFLHVDYAVAEGSVGLFSSTFRHQFNESFTRLKEVLRGSLVISSPSPRIVATVGAYETVGGIIHEDGEEDIELSMNLSSETRFRYLNSVRVYQADRARPEGYDASRRLDRLSNGESIDNSDETRLDPRIFVLTLEIDKLLQDRPKFLKKPNGVRTLFEKYGIPFNEYTFSTAVSGGKLGKSVAPRLIQYCREMGIETHISSNEYVDSFIDLLRSQLPPNEISELENWVLENTRIARIRLAYSREFIGRVVEMSYSDGGFGKVYSEASPKVREFFDRNEWISRRLETIQSDYPNPEKCMDALTTQYPEYLQSFEQSRLRRSTAVIQGITAFFHEALNNPETLPQTNKFLSRLR